MVFFEHGSTTLSAQSNGVLDNVAGWYRNTDIRRFRLIGHTDRIGSTEVNRQLGLQRAQAVRLALIRRGIRSEYIIIETEGETRPLVETPDDVAHIENRRVEIIAESMCRPPSGEPMNC